MIVGFAGRMGSGKNTAAARMAEMMNPHMPVQFVSFADKLKDSAAAAIGVDREFLEAFKNDPEMKIVVTREGGHLSPYAGISIREYLQRYGTEAHRNIFGDNFWVDQALDGLQGSGLVMVTDVRFPNEVVGIHDRDGIVVEIVGKDDPGVMKLPQGGYMNLLSGKELHPSEWPLDRVDYVINNGVHDDDFVGLDKQLRVVANKLNLPLKEVA